MQQVKKDTQCQTHATMHKKTIMEVGGRSAPETGGQRPIRPPQPARKRRNNSCRREKSDLLPHLSLGIVPMSGQRMRWCGNHHDRLTRGSLGGSLINVTISGSPKMSFDDADLHDAQSVCALSPSGSKSQWQESGKAGSECV